ncbi:hypothetical protein KKG52_02200 [Patescibacteria group bacterium]|nr:hypothetical protein [Patescibacteria group bacterium]
MSKEKISHRTINPDTPEEAIEFNYDGEIIVFPGNKEEVFSNLSSRCLKKKLLGPTSAFMGLVISACSFSVETESDLKTIGILAGIGAIIKGLDYTLSDSNKKDSELKSHIDMYRDY